MLPVVAKSYGCKHVAALEGDVDPTDALDCMNLLEGVDLTILDEELPSMRSFKNLIYLTESWIFSTGSR